MPDLDDFLWVPGTAVLRGAAMPALLAERQKVRELHRAEPVALCSGTIPCDRNHLTCEHCDEAWPCDTAEIVYTAEEITAVLGAEGEGTT